MQVRFIRIVLLFMGKKCDKISAYESANAREELVPKEKGRQLSILAIFWIKESQCGTSTGTVKVKN